MKTLNLDKRKEHGQEKKKRQFGEMLRNHGLLWDTKNYCYSAEGDEEVLKTRKGSRLSDNFPFHSSQPWLLRTSGYGY
ncbi:MAG TPA: hypothetical protein P5050_01460 [Bacteroidia bacterium]|nr:hypothetical protein [Bacteroidia bacterium]HRS57869.1 hypothetical protein [Bacteroidia bacterium]HRU69362.1 hypothetical protein [Bacteroidia bacterium]